MNTLAIGMPDHFELGVICVVVLLIFCQRLTKIIGNLGKGIAEFKKASKKGTQTMRSLEMVEKTIDTLNSISGWKLRIIKWLFPELQSLAMELMSFCGEEFCPKCGNPDVESPGLDANRYCNICNYRVN